MYFEVFYSRVKAIVILLVGVFHSQAFILGWYNSENESNNPVFLILGIIIFVSVLLFFINVMTFMVKISGDKITVRDGLRKRYEFQILDIKSVKLNLPIKSTRLKRIIIETETDYFDIDSGMKGYKTMAGYLLEQYADGKIRQSAMSVRTISNLELQLQ